MMVGAIAAGANVVGNIASTIISNRYNRQENERNRQWNLALAQQQNQWNIEQWNRENAYNTPSAQMQRYIDAGLNPNLIYGQPNLSAPSPEMTAGQGSQPTRFDSSMLANLALTAAQVRNLDAQTEKIGEETSNIAMDTKLKFEQIGLTKKEAELVVQKIDESKSAIDVNQKQIEVFDSVIKKNDADAALAKAKELTENAIRDPQVRSLIAKADMDETEAKQFAYYLVLRNANIAEDTALKKAQITHLSVEDRQILEAIIPYYQNLTVLGNQQLSINAPAVTSAGQLDKFFLDHPDWVKNEHYLSRVLAIFGTLSGVIKAASSAMSGAASAASGAVSAAGM